MSFILHVADHNDNELFSRRIQKDPFPRFGRLDQTMIQLKYLNFLDGFKLRPYRLKLDQQRFCFDSDDLKRKRYKELAMFGYEERL